MIFGSTTGRRGDAERIVRLEPLEDRTVPATTLELVRDVNPGAGGASTFELANLNGVVVFGANDGANGTELWRSDGTAAGTFLLKDIQPGAGSSSPEGFAALNGFLVFEANNGATGRELWKTDGTAAGTVLIRDLNPGTANGSNVESFNPLVAFNGALYFNGANGGSAGRELWKTDGTAAGTVLVANIDGGVFPSDPAHFAPLAGFLYFDAETAATGRELWKTDGTAVGTTLVKDVRPGTDSGFFLSAPRFVAAGNFLYFNATDGVAGEELWRTDGTAAGTVQVTDLSVSGGSFPNSFVNVGGLLFFNANGDAGDGPYRTDGTAAGTVKVSSLNPAARLQNTGNLASFNNGVVFSGNNAGMQGLFSAADPTQTGTLLRMFAAEPGRFLAIGSTLFFVADDGATGAELWRLVVTPDVPPPGPGPNPTPTNNAPT
ncbi:MAG: ELWxxDGT repeat protein, partial [Planctomycetia bacterium]